MSQTIHIGLIGFGTVGQGFYEILQQQKHTRFAVKRIGIKDISKARNADPSLFTDRLEDILEDETIDIVVEVIDDSDAAFQIIAQALKQHKKVVTANKKAVAEHFEELQQLRETSNGTLIFEAAVAGSIPILQSLHNYFANLQGESITAILNGSSNYILTQIEQEGKSYADALLSAQGAGFAESDPTLDVGGFDARYKLSLINSLLFGHFAPVESIPVLGIDHLDRESIQAFGKLGYRIKPVAYSSKNDTGGFTSWVAPALLRETNLLAQLDNELNGILVSSKFTGEQLFTGKGAGKFPTGSAVYNDVVAIADRNYRYEQAQADLNPVEVSTHAAESGYLPLLFTGVPGTLQLPEALTISTPKAVDGLRVEQLLVSHNKLHIYFDFARKHQLGVLVDLAGFSNTALRKRSRQRALAS